MNWIKRLPQIPSELRYILLLFLSTRLVLTIIGTVSHSLLDRQYGKQFVWAKAPWLDIWGVWDTFRYINIAVNGYLRADAASLSPNPPGTLPEPLNFAFFPLYPLLIKVIGTVIGGRYYIAGLLISNICLILACIFLYKLVEMESGRKIALGTIKFLFLFPTAFIFSGVFTESLYLFLVVASFYWAKTCRWSWVGIAGFLMALTRAPGVLLLIPLGVEYYKSAEFKLKNLKFNILFLLLIPAGLLVYASYNYYATGNFLTFQSVQAEWDRRWMDPISSLITNLYEAIRDQRVRRIVEGVFAAIALVLLNLFYRQIGFTYWLFSMCSILLPLCTGVISMPRFLLPVFPLYILFAKLGRNPAIDQTLTLVLGLLQGFFMVFWSNGYSLIV